MAESSQQTESEKGKKLASVDTQASLLRLWLKAVAKEAKAPVPSFFFSKGVAQVYHAGDSESFERLGAAMWGTLSEAQKKTYAGQSLPYDIRIGITNIPAA